MAARVTSSTFVGRSAELAELAAALEDAADGRPSLVFVAGDSGVGKTRLLAEAAAHARGRGARVLSGDCVDLGEGELPYAPLVAVLRALARAGDPALAQLPAPVRAELATLLPELGRAPATEPGDATAQSRLFEALIWLLDRLGQAAPVMLAIEDLHWADRPTRAFLAFIGRSLGAERLLVVCSYRTDELHRRHPLRPLLAELERDARSRRIELPPLTRGELATQLTGILGAAPEDDLVARVFARSEGHPLFVEELLAASGDGRGPLPPTLRDALMLRAERLPATAQEVLRVVAVGGRLDDELLEAATDLDGPVLREALREAVANNILVVDDGRYRFRHALLREVVHDDLLPGERAALHLRLARALEERLEREGVRAHLAVAVAHHYDSAGDQPAALRSAVRAADAAERVHAHRQAAHLLERAVELLDRVEHAEELAGADRAMLLWRAAENHRIDGDSPRQHALAHAALRLLDEREEPHRAARVLETLADAEWHLGRGERALATSARALALLPPGDVSPERTWLLARQAKSMLLRGRFADAEAAAREALPLADACGDRVAKAVALDTLGGALISLGSVDEGVAILREALELARAEDAIKAEDTAYVNLADALHLAGRLREAIAVADEGLARTLRPRNAWLPVLRAELALEAGDWDEAARILGAVRSREVGNSLVNLDLRRAELALGRGDHAAARALLDEAAATAVDMDEPQFTGVLAALRAELLRREGDLTAASACVREAVERLESGSEDATRLARLAAVGAAIAADAAQRARDLAEPAAERAAIAEAGEHVARAERAGASAGPLQAAWLLATRAERTYAAGAPDPDAFAVAAAAFAELERPYPAALLRLREAEAHAGAGDRAGAGAAARAARDTALRLGAAWLRAEIDGLATRARLDVGADEQAAIDGEDAAAAPEGSAADPFGLTPRERQVLALLMRGATNREIGADLFMSEKTASVHVSRILAKLDARSRTEAAGIAARLGLGE